MHCYSLPQLPTIYEVGQISSISTGWNIKKNDRVVNPSINHLLQPLSLYGVVEVLEPILAATGLEAG